MVGRVHMSGTTRPAGLTLTEMLRVLRRKWALVVGIVVVTTAAATAFVLLATPLYRAEAAMYVSVHSAGASNPVDLTQGGSYARQAVISYARVITSPIVLDRVVADLALDESAEDLSKSIVATTPADSVLINVSVEREDPEEAAAIANSLTENFTQVVEEVIERPQDGSNSAVQVTTIRPALVPNDPFSPATAQGIALGLVLGLIFGVAAAFLRTELDTRLRTPDDVQRITALPLLGEIPNGTRPGTLTLVVQSDPRHPRAESFRRLRTNLQFVNVDGRPRSFLITSPDAGDGKSTIACNLAIALAQTGVDVALVDADLRIPSVATYMGLDGAVGLSNVLAGLAELDDVLQPWGDHHLHVLPAGRVPPNPSELLSSTEMQDLHRTLTERFEYVIVDSPPVLAVTDATVLAGLTGGTILLVTAGRSRRARLLSAITGLEGIANHLSGIVLNGVALREGDRYGYGYGEEPKPPLR